MKEVSIQEIHNGNSSLKIFLFNVGQGDHIMLKFPTGEYGIIDFHYSSDYALPEPPVLSYFKILERSLPPGEVEKITISFFCISHTDKDHIKGINETIKWFDEHKIFIRNFWLQAAEDESQFSDFLNEQVPQLIKSLKFKERSSYSNKIKLLNKGISHFFRHLDRWKNKKFANSRYATESIGTGEYLLGIRPLDMPGKNAEAINMGPLTDHMVEYRKKLTLDVIKKMLCLGDSGDIDKNSLSHILRIKYREINLLFGGDTNLSIWDECLKEYHREGTNFVKLFGDYRSHFIKVSHHGSRNSSSPYLWPQLIPDKGSVFLGISAGQHDGYKHPHSETIRHIRDAGELINNKKEIGKEQNDKLKVAIVATNICSLCAFNDKCYTIEFHNWYDDYVQYLKQYLKPEQDRNDAIINHLLGQITAVRSKQPLLTGDYGLLAYVFEISSSGDEEVKMKVALSRSIKKCHCFYGDHKETLNEQCREYNLKHKMP